MKEHLTYQELKHASPSTIERLQNQRFRTTVQFLLPHVKFYKDLFKEYRIDANNITRVDDWQKLGLPLVQKAYFKRHPKEFIVGVPEQKAFSAYQEIMTALEGLGTVSLWLKALASKKEVEQEIRSYFFPKMPAFSGGTESGTPTPVMITGKQKQTLDKILQILARIITQHADNKKPIIGMNLFPYGPHLGWHAVHMALDRAADLNLCTAAGGAIPTERLVRMAGEFKANVFAGMSNYVRNRFLQEALKQKIRLPEQVLFINGATKMHEAERTKIASAAKKLGAKKVMVLDVFGASEFKEAMLPECAPGTGFHHIAPLSTIVRTVRAEEGKKGIITEWKFTKPEQGGYGVVWNIDGAGTLLEGYLIGDVYERVTQEPCEQCGLRVKRFFGINRIKNVETRLRLTGEVEEIIKGARIDLAALRNRLLKIPAVQEAQLKATRAQLIIILAGNRKKAESKVKNVIKDLEITPLIRWKPLEKLVAEDARKYKPIIIEQ